MSGTLMMAFTSKDYPWLMFPGLSLIGTGGMPILVTNVQVISAFYQLLLSFFFPKYFALLNNVTKIEFTTHLFSTN
jgi:hypothetical protein